jgi:hypothetical protein
MILVEKLFNCPMDGKWFEDEAHCDGCKFFSGVLVDGNIACEYQSSEGTANNPV